MKYFPIFLDANHISAMIIGGGDVAARKIELLLKSTTNITVMAESVSPSVQRLVEAHDLKWLEHNYQAGHLSGINLVIAATDDSKVNKAAASESQPLNILTNVLSSRRGV